MKTSPIDRSRFRSSVAIAVVLACAMGLGCSFSYSSESSSDSSNNSSESSVHSSDSSSPGKDESARFEEDVEQYTVAFLEGGGSADESFFSGLGDLARRHGVSDWESETSTWEAIGRGLARSPSSDAERIAYQAAWTGGDAAKRSALAKGISAAQ